MPAIVSIFTNKIRMVFRFERMGKGPEATSDVPVVTELFEQIRQTEVKYGRESVKEIARLYGVR